MQKPKDDFAHQANPSAEGDCLHTQPMWGFCSACRRYDAYLDQLGSKGYDDLPKWLPKIMPQP